MKLAFASLILVITAGMLAAADDEAVSKERKLLAGTWRLASMEEAGKAVPPAELPDISFTLHADGKSTVRTPGGEFETSSVIDPSRTPKTLDIEYLGGGLKGQKQYGIYKVEGDRWTVFSTPPGGKPEDRPKQFDSTKAKGGLIVWERVKARK